MKRSVQRSMWGAAMMAAMVAMPAMADDAPQSSVAGSVAVVNDYLFRGLSQTNWKPAVQPGIEYDHASGWYVGAWGSNISWLSDASTDAAHISSSLELDFYTGFRGSFAGDWSYDVGLYEYYYPGSYPSGFTRPYTTEVYGSLGYKGVTLKYSHALTNLFGFADSKNSGYVDLSYNVEFSPGWTLNLHAGHQDVKNVAGASYSDWKVGVTKAFDHGYSVSLGYYDTNASRSVYSNAYGHYVGRATGVLTLGKSF
ncbi:TorF family putative porin [Dyella ginsengisoli]|uniref:TorF family putative porin n=1 Tax=Dyella ginsengisoli TaxID=363848 RepID=UPI000476D423|nr:TorF family putative porin [Dyella ginsengisoli]